MHIKWKHGWFTTVYGGILNQDIFGSENVNSISVEAVTRRMNGDIRECGILTVIYPYVSFWAVSDVQITNSKIITKFESKNLHQPHAKFSLNICTEYNFKI